MDSTLQPRSLHRLSLARHVFAIATAASLIGCLLDVTPGESFIDSARALATTCGDANGDGDVTATDALIALQTAVGGAACPACQCDVSGDGGVTATDALGVLRTAVGEAVGLDCPPCSTTTTLPPTPDSADPFQGEYVLEDAAEVVLAFAEVDQNGAETGLAAHRVYDVPNATGNPPVSTLDPCGLQVEPQPRGLDGAREMDVMTGDLDGDDFMDIVSVWEGAGRQISAILPEMAADGTVVACSDGAPQQWTESNGVVLNPGGSGGTHPMNLRLEPGNFDIDPETEFVVAYWDGIDCSTNCPIRIEIFDTNGTRTPALVTTIADRSMPTAAQQARFDITAGDIDFDGKDEIVLAHFQPSTQGTAFEIFVQVYDVEPVSEGGLPVIQAAASAVTTYTDDTNDQLQRLAVEAGDFDDDATDELVLGFQVADSDEPTLAFLQTFEAVLGGDPLAVVGLTLDPGDQPFNTAGRVQARSVNGSNGFPLQVLAADLNGDALEEILIIALGSGRVFEPQAPGVGGVIGLSPVGSFNGGGMDTGDTHRMMAVANVNLNFRGLLDPDEASEPEIVYGIRVEVDPGIDPDNQLDVNVDTVESVTTANGRITNLLIRRVATFRDPDTRYESTINHRFAVALGDFDRDRLRLGRPTYRRAEGVVQPLALVNAPPVHFDVLDGQVLDISECFTTGACDSSIQYQVMNTAIESFSSEVSADWTLDAELGGGGNLYGVELGAKITAKYGEGFKQAEGVSRTTIATTTVPSSRDDLVYATVTNYDIWEYPVLEGPTSQGYLVAVLPRSSQELFSPSKNLRALVPTHEFGNWLSYPELPELSTSQDFINAFGRPYDITRALGGTGFTLTSTGDSPQWTVETITSEDSESQGTVTKSLGGGVSASAFGIGAKLNGEYTTRSVKTHRNSFTHSEALRVFMGTVSGVGQAIVTPFIYWTENDVLVVEYAVEPPTFGNTFWTDNYEGQPDPAFVLPWRYDDIKVGVNALPEPAFKERTKDVLITPINAQPGDRVMLTAVVRNFSLTATDHPIEVRFYRGDPDDGGTLLVGTQGESVIETDSLLLPRSHSTASMEWDIPGDAVLQHLRIYATLTMQGSDVTRGEIHGDNNKGWSDLVDSTLP